MHSESIPKTSFSTTFGKFEYTRMPFGIRNGPAHFQRCLSGILGNVENASVYIDDIVVFLQDFTEHLEHLEQVFQLLRQHHLTAKPSKLKLCHHQLEFLGHHIGGGRIQPVQAKINSFNNYPLPTCKKQLRTFLGATNYYRYFIQNYASKTSPLYPYLTKKSPERFQLNTEATEAFNLLKQHLIQSTFLTLPNPSQVYNLSTDASTSGVGAVLSQLDTQGKDRPIAYFSKRLLPYQKNYSATELELLAVVLAVQHFAVYLMGATFRLYTDHKALLQLNRLKTANGRLARWALILQDYNFDIIYRPGECNGHADALSRAYDTYAFDGAIVPSEKEEPVCTSKLNPVRVSVARPEGRSQRALHNHIFNTTPGGVPLSKEGGVG